MGRDFPLFSSILATHLLHKALQTGSAWILACQQNILISSVTVKNTIRSVSINILTTERSDTKNN